MSSVVNQCEGGNEELLEGVTISCKPITFRYEMEPKSLSLLYIRMLAAITGLTYSYILCENKDYFIIFGIGFNFECCN